MAREKRLKCGIEKVLKVYKRIAMPPRVHGFVERFYCGEAAGRQVTVREGGKKLPLALRADCASSRLPSHGASAPIQDARNSPLRCSPML
jgi:hypothetical protein